MPSVEPPAGGHVNVEAVASAVRSKDSRVRVAVAEVAVAVSVAVAVAVRISVEADVTRLLCELKVEVSLRQHPRPPGTPRRRCRGLRHINPRQIHAEPEPRCVDVPRTRRSVTKLMSVKKALGRRKN